MFKEIAIDTQTNNKMLSFGQFLSYFQHSQNQLLSQFFFI